MVIEITLYLYTNNEADANNLLRALVISPNEKTQDLGSLLAVARAEACRREHVSVNPTVRALVFVAELGVYVAVYEASDK